MRIAITGATGFLGRYIVRRLHSERHGLRCWYRDDARRAGLPEGIEWQRGVLGDADSAAAMVDGVDAVVHAALQWPGRGATRSRGEDGGVVEFARVNLLGSLMLMEEARRRGVKRFVYISSCAVHDVILPDRKLDESHPLWPQGHYGAHKAAVEKFVHSFGLGRGWPVCSLRPTGIYGVATPVESSKWYGLVQRVLRGEAISEAGGGKEVHADDVARAVSLLLAAPEGAIAGQAFNCYDMYISEQHVAEIAREASGSRSTIAGMNRGPKNQIDTAKIRGLGMNFGGEPMLRQTIEELVTQARR